MDILELLTETNRMLEELTSDLVEFGMNEELWAFCTFENGKKWYINYDFILDEDPVKREEVQPGIHLDRLPAWKVYDRLEDQKNWLWGKLQNREEDS